MRLDLSSQRIGQSLMKCNSAGKASLFAVAYTWLAGLPPFT